jgi:hypothetical protein
MSNTSRTRWAGVVRVVFGVVVIGALAGSGEARARDAGRIFLTKGRVALGGQATLASTARQPEVHMVWPSEEHGNDQTAWNVDYVTLFDRPLGDYEVELKFWDVTKGPARYIGSREQFTRDKQTRMMAGELKLTAPEFERNRRYLVIVSTRRGNLAQVTFWLRGTPPRYDGRVEFGDDESVRK